MKIPLLAVYGTFSGDFTISKVPCLNPDHWWHPWSAWFDFMKRSFGCEVFRADKDFSWTGGLEGVWSTVARLWRHKDEAEHRQWSAGGEALEDYIGEGLYQGQKADQFVVVAHSHGGQVALYCAASGRQIPILITVSTPHRADMRLVTEAALPNIGVWIHLYDPHWDKVGQEGQFGDGDVSFDRTQPLAHVNVKMPGCSHSGELRDPAKFALWVSAVWPTMQATLAKWDK